MASADFALKWASGFPVRAVEFDALISKISRYNRLPFNVSLTDRVTYCLYRLWNAVKAIFNQSDWQLTRKVLLTGYQQTPFGRTVKAILDRNHRLQCCYYQPEVEKLREAVADLVMCLFMDRRAEYLKEYHNTLYEDKEIQASKDALFWIGCLGTKLGEACDQISNTL